jgi:hypothetical protein
LNGIHYDIDNEKLQSVLKKEVKDQNCKDGEHTIIKCRNIRKEGEVFINSPPMIDLRYLPKNRSQHNCKKGYRYILFYTL